jgi:hypothetical protein
MFAVFVQHWLGTCLERGHEVTFRLHRPYLVIGMKSRLTDRRF